MNGLAWLFVGVFVGYLLGSLVTTRRRDNRDEGALRRVAAEWNEFLEDQVRETERLTEPKPWSEEEIAEVAEYLGVDLADPDSPEPPPSV